MEYKFNWSVTYKVTAFSFALNLFWATCLSRLEQT